MINFSNYWKWKEYDPQFSLLEIHYWNDGFIAIGTKYLEIIILNFSIGIEWEAK
jgi:hypothetical protein